ncbi:MAG: hypothetical protein KJ548_10490 [Actinobacteria bacterium]|nr:hypothetical protein [Actinomycetota bacterium]MCG2797888.1 hypothetical protein [Cellulomonas sp.]
MNDAVPTVVGAVVGGASAGIARAVLGARPPGGAHRWTRTNHAGDPVSMLEGPALAVGLLAGSVAAGAIAGERRAAAAVAVAGGTAFGFGLLDDLAEDRAHIRKGLRGHLGALAHGELTTGGAKVLGIGVGALAAAALAPDRAGGTPSARALDLLSSAALIAGTANLINLLDLRPGRALKAAVLPLPAVLVSGGPAAGPAGAVLGAGAAVARADLDGSDMLGDSGANALGAVLGTAVVLAAPRAARWTCLVAVVGVTLLSERTSLTGLIERTPVLRELDAWGRRGRRRPR